MANCQFKTLRDNTLTTNNKRETHAREINVTPYGEKPKQKNVKFAQIKKVTHIHQIIPISSLECMLLNSNFLKNEKRRRLFGIRDCSLEKTYNPPKIIETFDPQTGIKT